MFSHMCLNHKKRPTFINKLHSTTKFEKGKDAVLYTERLD